ncbi:hypothetical protein [Streptomyces sp. NBC_00829]|uniref:hypothetical protein n=1 Tax=Streptomyces sp. NBC_00829 TaxID=2903679 RepID=UPI0038634AE5|nr:hypothetical protein OG293_38125 [Streptomyces sp. NBC_00829]
MSASDAAIVVVKLVGVCEESESAGLFLDGQGEVTVAWIGQGHEPIGGVGEVSDTSTGVGGIEVDERDRPPVAEDTVVGMRRSPV